MKLKFYNTLIFCLIWSGFACFSQTADSQTLDTGEIIIPPLFEYPVAPDSLETLQQRTDYLIENFWNPFDFSSKDAVDQNALNDAFRVYASVMPYADPEKIRKSTKTIIGKIKKNPILTLQFTKAAEESLYGPRANMWIDEIYIPYLENIVSNKSINEMRKLRYKDQLKILKATGPGEEYPAFNFIGRNGDKSKFKPSKEITLIEFGNPDCDDCRIAKLKLDINGVLNDLLNEGRLEIAFIIPEEREIGELLEMTSDYPEKWTVGVSDDVFGVYDLRATPAFYILDKKGKIVAKNVNTDKAIEIVDSMSKEISK